MTEPIQLAVFTLIGTVIGGILGAIGSYKASKQTSDTHLKECVLNAYFQARLTSYQNLLSSFHMWVNSTGNQEYLSAFFEACASAIIVSSEETSVIINNLQNMVESLSSKPSENGELRLSRDEYIKYEYAKSAFVNALQSEMFQFSLPEIKI